ncbi:MAG: 2Fe-2S iron-sulfur cluster-binding protein [Mariprofundaceae bacterium]
MIIKTLENLQIHGREEETILDSALNSGHFLEYSCKNGQCGACKVTLLEGEVSEYLPQLALSEEDVKKNKILTCCCGPKTDVTIDAEDLSALQGIEVKTLPSRINRIVKHTARIIEVELRLPPSADFVFLEGQYVDIIGPNNLRRSYSLASSSSTKTISFFIKKVESGLFSSYWFNEAKENDMLRIEGPKGTFYLREESRHIVFLATGTGIAPVKSILDRLASSPEQSANISFSLYWGNRHPEDFFWKPEYSNLNLEYIPVLSRRVEDMPAAREGYVQDALMADKLDLENASVYACGSMDMINSAKEMLIKKGLAEKQFYSDAFVSS